MAGRGTRFGARIGALALAGLATLALASAIPAGAAAAKWKKGVYEGTIDAENGNRPKTEIKLRITKTRIKLIEAGFRLRCDSGKLIEATLGPSKKEKVTKGTVGGGFAISEHDQTAAYQENYSLVGGVKRKTAKGLIDASRTYEDPYDNCTDFITLEFKAKRR
jgi:hypothetical protein